MRKLNKRGGFTLAELLIVVAIIAVLVAIAIPVFSTQLERSRDAVDAANLRSAYAEAVADYLGGVNVTGTGGQGAYDKDSRTYSLTIEKKGTDNKWSEGTEPDFLTAIGKTLTLPSSSGDASFSITFNADGTVNSIGWSGSGTGGGNTNTNNNNTNDDTNTNNNNTNDDTNTNNNNTNDDTNDTNG